MPQIRRVETVLTAAAPPHRWLLSRVVADDGRIGLGDASDSLAPATTIAAIHELLAPLVLGRDSSTPPAPGDLAAFGHGGLRLPFEGLPLRTAASAIEMALWDLTARLQDVPLVTLLGGEPGEVPLYANVNRGLPDHQPETIADAARRALDLGFDAVKCAPFAGVARDDPALDGVELGLRRVEQVRAVIGDAGLLVDAHGRLDAAQARHAAPRLQDLGVGWFEEPARFEDDPAVLFAAAAASTVPVAAGELLPRDGYRALIGHGATTIVMTDVKHNGGVGATLAVGEMCAAAERRLSLHNPTGPVSTLFSAHIRRRIGGDGPDEYATHPDRLRESELLVGGDDGRRGGTIVIDDRPGIGIDLDPKALAAASVQTSE
jgi:galactonate dehydratase